jgi:hypothetical protein
MSEPQDMVDCELRNEFGRPMVYSAAGAAVHSNIDNSVNKALPWIVGLAVLATLGFSFGVMAKIDAGKAERESRMLQYYLLELDARVIAAGIKSPEEAISKKLEKERK